MHGIAGICTVLVAGGVVCTVLLVYARHCWRGVVYARYVVYAGYFRGSF